MATKAEKFLKLARDRFKLAEDATTKQRQREREDLRFYAGEQWDSDLLQARQGQSIGSGSNQQTVPARPSLTINKTREPVRQVLNQERQSDLGIELVPADDWGETEPLSHEEIELREGLVRRIQRESEAGDARTWAFARAAIAGVGYWVVLTRYVRGKSQDQDIYIERLYNQGTVLLDPSHEQADGSDADWGFWGTDMLQSAFKVRYPKAKAALIENDDQWRALGDEAPGWFTGEGDQRAVRVMNYVYTQSKPVEIYHLTNGRAATADELTQPEGDGPRVLTADPSVWVMVGDDGQEQCHTDVEKVIKWATITGCDVLDETDWPGHWLPIIKVVGEELQPYDEERRIEGIVRPMRDPCKGNNYIISKFVEQVGLTPIPPWMMAGGQDEGFEAEYQASTTRTISVLHYNQKDQFGQPVPQPPFRSNVSTDVASIATGVQIFGQAIQATSVTPETALGNTDPTVKSGKLARALIEQGERGNSNFLDNLVRSLRHEGRVINDLLYPIYGRPGRLARIVTGQGEMSTVLIGQPFTMQGEGKYARPVKADQNTPDAKTYQLTENASMNVAVKVSKSVETRRQQIADFLGNLISASPEQMGIIGDKLWKYLDLPDHTEIEERYKVMLAPQVQQLIQGKDGQANVQQLQQQLQQASEMIKALSAELQQRTRQIETEAVKAQQRLSEVQTKEAAENERELAKIQAQQQVELEKLALERRKLEIQLEIEMAKLGSAQSMARAEIEQQDLHHHDEMQLRHQEQQSADAQATLDRQAQIDQANADREAKQAQPTE